MISKNLSYETLHCHTKASDGQLTHKEVLDICRQNKIGVVAFTDHDTLPDFKILQGLKSLNHDVKFIPGIEMSANFVKEVKGKISLFHIVGLFVDILNKPLIEFCHWAKEKRLERAQKIVKNLTKLGFDIKIKDVESFARGEIIGRPHIAKAILSKKNNLKILGNILKHMGKVGTSDVEINIKYQEVLTHNRWQQIFDLVLDDHSFIKGVYVHYLYPISMDEGVRLIRQAGGIALLAHWSFYKDKINLSLVEKFCKEKRIDGIETVYGFEVEAKKRKEFLQDMTSLSKLTTKYKLGEGGGGDFHNRKDFKLMLSPQCHGLAQKTKGLVEKILALGYNLEFQT